MTLRSIYAIFGVVGILAFATFSAQAQQASAPSEPSSTPPTTAANAAPSLPPIVAQPTPNGITIPPLVTAANAGNNLPASSSTIPATQNPALSIGGPPPPPPAPTGPVLTLDQVVAQVLANNPTVLQARIAAKRARAEIPEATGQGLPQIRIDANDTYSSSPQTSASSGAVSSVSPTASIPTITDSAYNSLSTGASSTSSSSLSGTANTTSGTGTSTTTSSTTSITPVGAAPSAGSVQTNSATTISPTAPVSGSSGTVSPSTGQARPRAERPAQTTVPVTTASGNTNTNLAERLNNWNAGGEVTQILDIFGIVHAASSAAKENAAFYDLDLQRVEDDTALSAKTTYFAVLLSQSNVGTDQELLRNAQATLANAQIQYNAGASPQLDVISAQAEVASAQAALITAQNELQVEQANLNNLLARSIDSPVNVAVATVHNVPSDTSADQQIAVAEKQRPEVQQTTLTQAIAQNLTHISQQGNLPSLGLRGAVDYNPNPSSLTGASNYDESITATVSFPLYDGGQTAAAVKAGRLNEQEERSVADQLQQDVALEVKTALLNVVDAQTLVTADESAVTSFRAALNIAGISYQAGVGTLLDVTNAEANLANAEGSLNSAMYQQQTAYATLQRAEGSR